MSDTLAGANIALLKNALVSGSAALPPDITMSIESALKEAMAAQAAGDDERAIEVTTKVIRRLTELQKNSP